MVGKKIMNSDPLTHIPFAIQRSDDGFAEDRATEKQKGNGQDQRINDQI